MRVSLPLLHLSVVKKFLGSVMGREPRNEETATMAGDLAIDSATPLRYNGYKIPLMRNLVKRAIRGTGTQATT